jgi:5'-3' exonuclease
VGVQNLWAILRSAGVAVDPESLSGKVLAIGALVDDSLSHTHMHTHSTLIALVDTSIWLYQFVKAMRDGGGEMLPNAHLIGMFRRIVKLLFWRVRPVFVFDGAAPHLKKLTMQRRRSQQRQSASEAAQSANKLLRNKLKQTALAAVATAASAASGTDAPTVISAAQFASPADVVVVSSGEAAVDLSDEIEVSRENDDDPDYDANEAQELLAAYYQLTSDAGGSLTEVDEEVLANLDERVQLEFLLGLRRLHRRETRHMLWDLAESAGPSLVHDPRQFSEMQVASLIGRSNIARHERAARERLSRVGGQRMVSDANTVLVFESDDDGDNHDGDDHASLDAPQQQQQQHSVTEPPAGAGFFFEDDENEPTVSVVQPQSVRAATPIVDEPASAAEPVPQPLGVRGDEDRWSPEAEACAASVPVGVSATVDVGVAPSSLADSSSEIAVAPTVEEVPSIQIEEALNLVDSSSEDAVAELPVPVIEADSPVGVVQPAEIVDVDAWSEDESEAGAAAQSSAAIFEVTDTPPRVVEAFDTAPRIVDVVETPPRVVDVVETPPRVVDVVETPPRAVLAVDTAPRAVEVVDSPARSGHIIEDEAVPPTAAADVQAELAAASAIFAAEADSGWSGPELSMDRAQLAARLQAEQAQLHSDVRRQASAADQVTPQMVQECKELLDLFGLPYIEAPYEAEAQCAALQSAGLVDGVVTDDGDTFLFGASTVYRQLFRADHEIELYTAAEIATKCGLERRDLIDLALLVGSDYTDGVRNIGHVRATEIVALFKPLGGLTRFAEWYARGTDAVFDKATPPVPISSAARSMLRSLRPTIVLPEGFPHAHVVAGYLQPSVDDALTSDTRFEWTAPDFDALRAWTAERFGWTVENANRQLQLVLDRYSTVRAAPRQRTIQAYFQSTRPVAKRVDSVRLANAIAKLRGGEDGSLLISAKRSTKRKAPKGKATAPKRKAKRRARDDEDEDEDEDENEDEVCAAKDHSQPQQKP